MTGPSTRRGFRMVRGWRWAMQGRTGEERNDRRQEEEVKKKRRKEEQTKNADDDHRGLRAISGHIKNKRNSPEAIHGWLGGEAGCALLLGQHHHRHGRATAREGVRHRLCFF